MSLLYNALPSLPLAHAISLLDLTLEPSAAVVAEEPHYCNYYPTYFPNDFKVIPNINRTLDRKFDKNLLLVSLLVFKGSCAIDQSKASFLYSIDYYINRTNFSPQSFTFIDK